MPQALIKINGVDGSNDDLPIGVLVNLSNHDTGGEVTYAWTLLKQPPGAADALSATNIKSPTFTPRKEGTYRLQLIVNAGMGALEKTSLAIVGIRDVKTGERVPGPDETTETGADGWSEPAMNTLLRGELARAADPMVIVGVNGSGGGFAAGTVARVSGVSTLKAGLPGEEVVPSFVKALATTIAGVTGALHVVVAPVRGALPVANGALGRFRRFGLVQGIATGGAPALGDPVYVSDTGTLDIAAGTVPKEVGNVVRFGGGTFDCLFHGGAETAVDTLRHLATSDLGSAALGPVDVRNTAVRILFGGSADDVVPLGVHARATQTADLFVTVTNGGTKQTYIDANHYLQASRVIINQAGVDAGASDFLLVGASRTGATKYTHTFGSWNSAAGIRLYRNNADTGVEQNTILDIGRSSTAAVKAQINLVGGDGVSLYGGRIYTSSAFSALVIDNDGSTALTRLVVGTPSFVHGAPSGSTNFTPDFRIRGYSTFYSQEANLRVQAVAGAGFLSTITLDGALDGVSQNLDLDFTYVRLPGTELRLNTRDYLTGTGADGPSIRSFAQSGAGTTNTYVQNLSYANGWRFFKQDNASAYTSMIMHLGVEFAANNVTNTLKIHGGDGGTAFGTQLYTDPLNAAFHIGNNSNVVSIFADMTALRLGAAAGTFSASSARVTLRGNDGGALVQQFQVIGDHVTGAVNIYRETAAAAQLTSNLILGVVNTTNAVTSGLYLYGGTGAVHHGAKLWLDTANAAVGIESNDGNTQYIRLVASLGVWIPTSGIKLDQAADQTIAKSNGNLLISAAGANYIDLSTNGSSAWRVLSTGVLQAQGANRQISSVLDPASAQDAATKNYVDTKSGPTEIVFGNSATSAAAGTFFLDPCFGVRTATANEIRIYCGAAGTISNLYLFQRVGSTGGNCVYTVRKNGVDQTLTATIAAAGTTGNDTAHSFTVAKGDYISIKQVAGGGTSAGATDVTATVLFTLG
jgi:hypothetical protein